MCPSHQGRFRQQFHFLRQQFLQEGPLPLTNVLSADTHHAGAANDRGWLEGSDFHAAGDAVGLSGPGAQRRSFVSCRSGSLDRPSSLSRGTSLLRPHGGLLPGAKAIAGKVLLRGGLFGWSHLDAQADPRWLWNGRRVYLFDGTTVIMPDTPENQAAYPQVYNQQPGVGFPIARIGAITSLACGAIVNLGICRYAGKGQGEVSLLRKLWDVLRPGDILLTDRLMANWTNIFWLQERGLDFVSRLNKANRKADFRRGKRLGPQDHIVRWRKPTSIRSLDRQTYNSLPESITVREARIRVMQPGFRTRSIVVVTTMLDPAQATKEDSGQLYRARWNNELDLRSIKSTMQMRRAALQDAGTGPQGNLDAYPGLQSDSHDHGSGRDEASMCYRARSASKARFKPWKPFSR